MIRSRIRRSRRLLAILTAAMLGVTVLGIAPVSAATPGWTRSNAVSILDTVGPGKDTGFRVSLFNDGPGNMSTLYLVTNRTQAPSYVSDSRCTTTGGLFCNFGPLNAGQSIELIVAYTVPTSGNSFGVTFMLNTVGSTGSDKGKNSRGDDFPFSASTAISTGGGDFDAGFNVGNDTFQTNPSLGPRNIQSTALTRAPELVPVIIQDGITALTQCDSTADHPRCATLFGEWSRLNVNNGLSEGPFKVTLVIRGSAVPGNPDPESIVFVHVLDDGSIDIIGDDLKDGEPAEETCQFAGTDPVPTNVECRIARKVGSNWLLEVWLFRNGFGRGGF